jgi:hypothetical protein
MDDSSANTVLFGLSKTLFWDVDLNEVDVQKNAMHIIEKVMLMGTLSDFRNTIKFYGKPKVKKMVMQIRYMDDRQHHFCSIYFNIPLEQFRCYTTKQLNQTHWSY